MYARVCKLRSYGITELFSVSVSRYALQYSTSTTTNQLCKDHSMVYYLVNSFGFSREAAVSATAKVSKLKSNKNPKLLLEFFLESGLDKTQIRNIVSSVPALLSTNVDKTLKPKFKVFLDLGFSGSDLERLISGNPTLMSRGLDTYIVPSIEYLKDVLRTEENVVKVIKRSKWLLSYHLPKRMSPNILLLQKSGFSNVKIEKFIISNPNLVIHKPKWLEGIMRRVEVKLGIPRDAPLFLNGVEVFASVSESTVEVKFGIFRSFGMSDSDIITMARKLPETLTLSEAKISKGLKFFIHELGYTPEYIVSRPKLLMHSFERRVFPRNAVLKILKEKKLIKTCLYSVLCMTELKFLKVVLLPHKDKVPDLYEAYINRTVL